MLINIWYMYSCKSVDDFIKLYAIYYKKIFNFFLRNLNHMETAEDLTSNSFINALKYIKTKKSEIRNFNGWIYKIATNELFSYLKNKRRKDSLIVENNKPDFMDAFKDEKNDNYDFSDYLVIREAMNRLKQEERLIVEMHFFEKLKYEEMSVILNMKETSIRSIVHRTIKKMRKIIDREQI